MVEKTIFEENNLFIIRKEIEGELIEFGSFSTLEEAISKRDELEEDGWPYNPKKNKDTGEYGKYISKNGDKYIVSRKILGEEVIFGKFSSLKLAKEFKYKLIEHAWDDSFLGVPSKYGKFIFKEGKNYKIIRTINGERKVYGVFKSLDAALEYREKLIEENWETDKNLFHKSKYGKYIQKGTSYYYITKSIDGKPDFFGRYDTLNDAERARDILLENNWDFMKIPEELLSWSFYTFYNFKTYQYEIRNTIDNTNLSFGFYENREDARTAVTILRNNNWDCSKIPFSLLAKNAFIRKFSRRDRDVFTVVRRINGEIQSFGIYDSYEEAIDNRNKLLMKNWVQDEVIEEKFDEYIYLRNDNKYYLKKEIDGINHVFGCYEDFTEALTARLECMKKNWKVNSIPEEEYFDNDSKINEMTWFEEDEYTEPSFSAELIEEELENIEFPVTVGKSYKNRGWAVKRIYLKDLIPEIAIEKYVELNIEGELILGKINLHTRLFYNVDKELSEYLEELFNEDPTQQCIIKLPLDYGQYIPNKIKNKTLKYKTRFSKSFKQGMFVMPRNVSKEIIPKLEYEENCYFYVDDYLTQGKLNIECRVIINDPTINEYLESFKEENEEINIEILLWERFF